MSPSPRDDRREILIVGLGSAGRRHLANLRALGWCHFRLCRTGTATLPDVDLSGWPVERDLDAALARRPVAVVVSNPSSLHVPVAIAAARAGAHLLIEKPLSHDLAGLDELEATVARADVHALVGFQFRFHPSLCRIARWLADGAIGSVVSVQAHWGEYLPDMHPWEDHRRGYAARAELGGGVLRTLCHPFDYLRWLLGPAEVVAARASERRLSGVDVDTCVDVLLAFDCGATGSLHLDFVQRPTQHHFSIVGTEGTITRSQRDHVARRFDVATGAWETVAPPTGFERNTMFLDEMRHFLACIHGNTRPVSSLPDGREAVRLTVQAHRLLSEGALVGSHR